MVRLLSIRLRLFWRLTCSHQEPPGLVASGLAAIMWRRQCQWSVDHQHRTTSGPTTHHRLSGYRMEKRDHPRMTTSHHSSTRRHAPLTTRDRDNGWMEMRGRNSVDRSIGGQAMPSPGVHHNGHRRLVDKAGHAAIGRQAVEMFVWPCGRSRSVLSLKHRRHHALGLAPPRSPETRRKRHICRSVLFFRSKAFCVYYKRIAFATHFWTRQTCYCVPLEE